MVSNDPLRPAPGEGSEPSAAADPLYGLQERLRRASDTAERLIAEAAQAAASAAAPKPPPSGWQQSEAESGSGQGRDGGELELLVGVFRSLRDAIPPELAQRLAAALREVLLALRALIDWYLERVEQRRAEPTEVQDIPVL